MSTLITAAIALLLSLGTANAGIVNQTRIVTATLPTSTLATATADTITLNAALLPGLTTEDVALALEHEGQHVSDFRAGYNETPAEESRAYAAQVAAWQTMFKNRPYPQPPTRIVALTGFYASRAGQVTPSLNARAGQGTGSMVQ